MNITLRFASLVLFLSPLFAAAGCADVPAQHTEPAQCDGGPCGCTTDSECTGGRRCDPTQKRCVQCLGDADCAAGSMCAASACVPGCSAGHGCGGGDAGVCEVDAGACVECASDGDCKQVGRTVCDPAAHACVPCLPSADPSKDACGANTYCAKGQGGAFACVPGCKVDSDCAGGDQADGSVSDGGSVGDGGGNVGDGGAGALRCDTTKHVCASCLADADCGTGTICHDGACVAGCTAAHGCATGMTCCSGACVDLTADPSDCGACGHACLGGWSCCNSTCANPSNDDANCGGCGKACVAANATTSCAMRSCAVASCMTGFGDCNGAYGDGCEIDLTQSAANCGACNHVCAVPHATAKCVASSCAVDTCVAPWADCDGDPTNGCELDVSQDPAHCGGCATACSVPHATAACGQGLCKVGSCDAGWSDCDGDPMNGCEVHTAVDASHCGSCATVCSQANGGSTCVVGHCQIGCNAGFGDCNHDPSDGCETNLSNTVTACGGCGMACSLANANAACVNGSCAIGSCATGWFDCDGIAANGCETHVAADAKSCGACNNACSTNHDVPSCVAGTCALACNMGFADCDHGLANGCETSLANDPMNCGGCMNACVVANATAACASGMCAVGTCATDWADCNGDPRDGCETNTQTDATSCGGCHLACSNMNGAPSCVSGSCRITCTAGFGDCDANVANGCETSTNTDAANCGACGTVCSSSHIAHPTCAMGACNGACDAGYYDCNGNKQSDGCESQTANDPNNCGACGTICSNNHITTPTCGASVCNGACDAGFGDCNGNKQTDGCEAALNTATNCGACGVKCGGGAQCIQGRCTVPCSVKVNEVQTGGAGGASDEWVELYNPCGAAVDLTGWRILYRSAGNNMNAGDTAIASLGGMLASGGYLLYVGAAYTGTAPADGSLTNSLAATGGAVGVRDGSQNLIDSVSYDTLTTANSFTETAPAPNPPSGKSIARIPNGQDTNDNAVDFQVSAKPTPRAANM